MGLDTERCAVCAGRGYINCACWPGDCICGYGDEDCDQCEGTGVIEVYEDEYSEPLECEVCGSSIQDAAQKLHDMLMLKGGKPIVDNAAAQEMFDAAYDKSGFDAVSSFLDVCRKLPTDLKEA